MPIPFDRFRLLNETSNPIKVANYSSSVPAEAQIDDGPIEVVPPKAEIPVPPGADEIAVRRQDEDAEPIEIAIVVTS